MLETKTPQTVHLIGQKSLGWGKSESWVFIQCIDEKKLAVGTHITVTKNHPSHQNSLESLQNSANHNTLVGDNILLQGTIVGLSKVKEGEALYIVQDDIQGKLTTIRVPVKRTDINMDGGWTWVVKSLWGMNGLLLKYPTRISKKSLWGSGAVRTDTTPSGFAPRDS